MSKLSDEELVKAVDSEFSNAMGSPGGEISTERAKAYDYYLSKPLGNEIEGQSQVVTSDVADVVDSIMPSLLRIFTTADNLVGFDATGEEDEEGAEQESDYVNHVFFKQNPAFLILFFWFFDALVQKNGIVKAWWDDSKKVTQESYKGLTEEELFDLLDDEELEIVERSEREAETVAEDGVTPVIATLHDVTFRRTTKVGRVRVENTPPEEYRISSDSRSPDPSAARFVGQEREVKRYELVEMGFDKKIVESLAARGHAHDSPEAISRKDKTDDTSGTASDKSQDAILLREAYIRVDDGKGGAELHQVFTSGNHLLSDEVVDRQPFHVICPSPLPHKHFGRSPADKVMDVQELQSVLLRQILDNLYHTNNPGHAVWEQGMGDNTLDDLLTTRVGRVARFSRPVGESYQSMTVPFTAGASFPMVEYFDKVKRDRTGINSDSEGLDPDALKNIQKGVMAQATDLARMKIEAIARIFAETGIKSLFLHIHELLLKHQQKTQVVKLRGRWVEVDPQQWRNRMDMTVNIGLGIGNRESNLMHLTAIMDLQTRIIEGGGMNLLVTPDNVYSTAKEFVKNANLKQPEMFFTDPQGQLAPPPSDEEQQIQQQAMALEQQRQEQEARKHEINTAKVQLEAEKARVEHEREMLELERKRNADEDRHFEAMEKLRNELTELSLKYDGRGA